MKKGNKTVVKALLWCVLFLVFIILLENVTRIFPHAPRIFKPTSQLFTVLKKTAVYALVAVSMNLLNGFTGLFSLGQAGFMLLGAYTYAILTVPAAERAERGVIRVRFQKAVAGNAQQRLLLPPHGVIIDASATCPRRRNLVRGQKAVPDKLG